ncbi:heme-binding domain-containing protein [Sediminicola luteus]|uniref:Cytochrome C n=1 Tax=Sediminicola luteus TaxID=319238 RepID=A0A2A4G385_9FLAO|nr:heme-binding domain-containing protein [Sediminicola luteus]PCE62430.1 cytochrome C [Sediminicola luteus]
MKLLKKIAWALLIVFVGMQFFRPETNTAEAGHLDAFLTETNPSQEVRLILKQACNDCHSNQTIYPWYSNIAPISYWMDEHIEHGKEELNFSEWATYKKKKKDHKLEELVEEVEEGKMPLNEYTWTHVDAKLTDGQIKALTDWAKRTRALYQIGERPQ